MKVRFLKVEKAKEYESFKRVPKFNHVSMAVINPSPRKMRSPPKSKSPTLNISATSAKIQIKKYEPKQIPDHLLRAPMDSFTSSPTAKKSGTGGGRAKTAGGSRKGASNKSKDSGKKLDGESKKVKRAEINRKVLF